MEYKLVAQVSDDASMRPVALRLQQRISGSASAYYVGCWRTRYPNTAANRRFYWLADIGCWIIPVWQAARLLDEAAARGLLDERYDDPYMRFGGGTPHFVMSEGCDPVSRTSTLREITHSKGEPEWGASPLFVIGEEPGGSWRKVMLVDTAREVVTFRSLTTDRTYKPSIDLGVHAYWRLDNAMLDCSTQILRIFRNVLRMQL
jgi:hypothetical protein